jgi:hypothetical protein
MAQIKPAPFFWEFGEKRGFSTASTSEFTGLRGFSRRSGGMMG